MSTRAPAAERIPAAPRARCRSGFTLAEVLTSAALSGLIALGVLAFFLYALKLSERISQQAEINRETSQAAAQLTGRVRLCSSFSVSSDGTSVTLNFDLDPAIDSNRDGLAYNDPDATETFTFVAREGEATRSLERYESRTNTRTLLLRDAAPLGGDTYFDSPSAFTLDYHFTVVRPLPQGMSLSAEAAGRAVKIN